MSNIAIVVPTIRPQSLSVFLEKWRPLFYKHQPYILLVLDGDKPKVELEWRDKFYSVHEIMGKYSGIIYNQNDGVRNLGFALIAKEYPEVEYIITLDDDCYPIEGTDPIQDHIDALNMKVPVSWMSTASEYMRGFPYAVRDEAEVVLSHGVWDGVKDWDAATQLTHGNRDVTFYKGVIPKGVLFPMCIMNVAFKRCMLPYMYQAPMGHTVGLDRFADIWCGINAKRTLDEKGWAAVSGYSTIWHDRASNVFTNLVKEAKGIGLNETYWSGDESDPYFKLYNEKRTRWEEFINKHL